MPSVRALKPYVVGAAHSSRQPNYIGEAGGLSPAPRMWSRRNGPWVRCRVAGMGCGCRDTRGRGPKDAERTPARSAGLGRCGLGKDALRTPARARLGLGVGGVILAVVAGPPAVGTRHGSTPSQPHIRFDHERLGPCRRHNRPSQLGVTRPGQAGPARSPCRLLRLGSLAPSPRPGPLA